MKHVYGDGSVIRPPARVGVTLAEVLVSIAIMSIGVILLSTLLPISILRTAQATQLTQAVMLRNNAEAAIESNLGIVNNSQICGDSGVGVLDPIGYFLVGNAATSTSFGSLSGSPPNSRIPRASGGILGHNITQVDQPLTTANQYAALAVADSLATLPDSWGLVREVLLSAANTGATPPTITTTTPTADLLVRNGANPLKAPYRVIMYDITGKSAVIRPIYQTAGTYPTGSPLLSNQLSWQNFDSLGNLLPVAPMPGGFVPVRARIETQDRRFTWIMTVAKRWVPTATLLGPDNAPGVANIDDDGDGLVDNITETHIANSDDDQSWDAEISVAVFYNRTFKATDEFCFPLLPPNPFGFDTLQGVANVDDDNDGQVDSQFEVGWRGSDDNRTVTISFGPNLQPPLRKGGYLLEPSQLRWYRIINFTPLPPTGGVSTVLLDRDIPPTVTQAIVMKGIVEVYQIGVRSGMQ